MLVGLQDVLFHLRSQRADAPSLKSFQPNLVILSHSSFILARL